MDKTRGQRNFLTDLAYKWTPLALVVYLFIICTAMLSVSGRLSHAEVIGFCVTAGLLIAFFATCHLVLYCTSIKEQVDLEKNQGHSSTTSSSSHPGGTAPAGPNPQPSAGVHEQPPTHQDHDKTGPQVSQSGPSRPRAGNPQVHPAGPRPNANLQVRVEDAQDEEPVRRPPLRVTNGLPQSARSITTTHLQPPRQRVRSHASAAPQPLYTRTRQAGRPELDGGQREYKPYRRANPKTPSHDNQAGDSRVAVGDVSSLHAAALTPEAALDSVRRTMGREPWVGLGDESSSRRSRGYQGAGGTQGGSRALGNVPTGQRVGRQLFVGSLLSPDDLVRHPNQANEVASQVGSQSRPVELSAGNVVQGYFLLLQEPDVVDLLSRRLLEWKPRPCPPAADWSGHGILEKHGTRRDDTGAVVVVADNPERKPVSIQYPAVTLGRMRSQRAQVQHQHQHQRTTSFRPWRRSADSGYCSVDKNSVPSVSTSPLHAWGRNSGASSSSAEDRGSFVWVERRRSSLCSEGGGDGVSVSVSGEVLGEQESRRRASTSS